MSNYLRTIDEIYASLDRGDHKQAQKLCHRSDVVNFTLTKSLLAYSYSCTRDTTKAMELAKAVASTKPTDDGVLNAIGCAFRQLRAEKEYASLYEEALKSKVLPDNTIIDLFNSYCRLKQPKSMQAIAQKLYKLSNSTKIYYLYWSITCMLLQEYSPTLLMIAEKTSYKILYELSKTTQPSADELSLYLYILMKQNKYTDALQSLNDLYNRQTGPQLIDENHFTQNVNLVRMHQLQYAIHKLDLLLRDNNINNIIIESKNILLNYPDQWNVHKLFVNCIIMIEFNNNNNHNSKSIETTATNNYEEEIFPQQDLSSLLYKYCNNGSIQIDTTAMKTNNYVVEHRRLLKAMQFSNSKCRSPYLAELLLLSQWIIHKKDTTQSVELPTDWDATAGPSNSCESSSSMQEPAMELARLIVCYVDKFKTKQCCYSDVKPYLHALVSFNTDAVAWIKEWAIQQRSVNEVEVQAAMKEARDSSQSTSKPTDIEISDAALPNEEDEGDAPSTAATSGSTSAAAKKKKKKQKKAKKKGSADAQTPQQNAAVQAVVQEHSSLLLLLCSYCKFDQIVSYCDTLLASLLKESASTQQSAQSQEMVNRFTMFRATRELFLHGVGGEERNVQPGDELLIQNSSLQRNSISSHCQLSSDHSARELYATALKWCRSLLYAKTTSPYNFAFKLDLIEPYRILGIGEWAYAAFGEMGVKHMQYDSMSYLIIPTLIESGMFSEAGRQHRAVINFHLISKRDSLDMMGRAFQYGNYMKAIELNQFADKCTRSIQLALSKTEIVQLEVMQQRHNILKANNYLKDIIDDKLPESHTILSDTELNNLIGFMDYNLLVRTDDIDPHFNLINNNNNNTQYYRSQMIDRIRYSQNITLFLYNSLEGNIDKAIEHFQQVLLLCNNTTTNDNYVKWDQRISLGRKTESESLLFEKELSNHNENIIMLCLNSLNNIEKFTSNTTTTNDNNINNFHNNCKIMIESCFKLRNILINGTIGSKYLSDDDNSIGPLNPVWIRLVSAFMRTSATWVPLLLQKCFTSFPNHFTQQKNDNNNEIETVMVDAVLKLSINDQRSQQMCLSELDAQLSINNETEFTLPILKKCLSLIAQIYMQFLDDLKNSLKDEVTRRCKLNSATKNNNNNKSDSTTSIGPPNSKAISDTLKFLSKFESEFGYSAFNGLPEYESGKCGNEAIIADMADNIVNGDHLIGEIPPPPPNVIDLCGSDDESEILLAAPATNDKDSVIGNIKADSKGHCTETQLSLALSQQIVTSQSLTCSRIASLLENKIATLSFK